MAPRGSCISDERGLTMPRHVLRIPCLLRSARPWNLVLGLYIQHTPVPETWKEHTHFLIQAASVLYSSGDYLHATSGSGGNTAGNSDIVTEHRSGGHDGLAQGLA